MSQQPHVVIPDAMAGAVEATVEGGALDGATALVVSARNLAFIVVGAPDGDSLKVTCGTGRNAPPPHVIATALRAAAANLEAGCGR